MSSERFVAAYVAALKLCAVSVIATPAGLVRFAAGDVQPGAGKLQMVRWCQGADKAEFLIGELANALRGMGLSRRGGFEVEPDVTERLVAVVAQTIGVELLTEAELRAKAEAAIGAVERQMATMKASGALRAVNRRYRDERLALTAAGRKAPPYTAWLGQFKARMIAEAAAVGKANRREILASPTP